MGLKAQLASIMKRILKKIGETMQNYTASFEAQSVKITVLIILYQHDDDISIKAVPNVNLTI